MNPVLHALSLLTPYEIDIPKIRLGPNGDGGYVFADNLSPDQSILSYGISYEYRFDIEMANRGHRVFMFDHTIDGIDASSPNMAWFKEGVAGKTDERARLYSIQDHLGRHGITGDRLILKIDVEGAEIEVFETISDVTLKRFDQIVLELHDLYSLKDAGFRARFIAALSNLNRNFTLFHVHANNYDGPDALQPVDGMVVSNLLELSYIRTDTVSRSPNRTVYPSALDYPNVGMPDKLLWFYPFLPSIATANDFLLCEQRVSALHSLQSNGLPF